LKTLTRQLALVALAAAAYGNSFAVGFPLDNKALILQDPRVHDATRANLDLILNRSYWWPIGESGLYRPVTTVSYLFNYAILGNGDRPFGYHVVNLALHVANVLLLYALLTRMEDPAEAGRHDRAGRRERPNAVSSVASGFSRTSAFAAAAIWAVHPLSTEAVTNIVGRADLLAAAGILGGLLMCVKATEARGARRSWWLLGLAAITTVGVFSKESAIVSVGVIVLYIVALRDSISARPEPVEGRARRARGATSAPRAARGALPGVAVALLVPLILFWLQRSAVLAAAPAAEFPFVDNPIAAAGFWQGRFTAVTVMARYLGLIAWPATLSADYSYAQIPLATGRARDWLAVGVVALLAAGCMLLWRRERRAFFWAAFAFVTLLPAANLLFPTGTIMAERVMYLPSAGVIAAILIGVAQGFSPAIERRTEVLRHFGFAMICAAVLALAARTWIRNKDWHDDLTLWTSAVEASPNSFKAHRGLAEVLYDADATHENIARVVAEIERAVDPLDGLPDSKNDARTYRQAGAYRLEQGDLLTRRVPGDIARPPNDAMEAYTRAEALLTRCLRIIDAHASPVPSADAYRLLSAVDVRLQKPDLAIDAATRARTLDPLNAIGYRQAAAAYLRANRTEDAAIVLMTGSLVTSDRGLRDELVDLYKRGLDPLGCALVQAPTGPAIDPSCATVRRHACAAVREAMQIHERAGRPDLAQRLREGAARQFQCP